MEWFSMICRIQLYSCYFSHVCVCCMLYVLCWALLCHVGLCFLIHLQHNDTKMGREKLRDALNLLS